MTGRSWQIPAFFVSILSACTLYSQDPPPSTLLFDSGKDGYPRYRIPSLVPTPNGTLIALCEGRKDGRGLTGNIDIVQKRSLDGGKTWSPLEIVADDGPHTLGNPCPVYDPSTKTLWLALTRSHGPDTEEMIVAGTSKETTRVLLTFSKDDGVTWAPLCDITADVRLPSWTWYGTGPGIGLRLSSGRLVIPSYHAEAGSKNYRSHMIFSDDQGKTWKRGDSVGDMVSECQIAQRRDGVLVLNTRTLPPGKQKRTIAFSKDEGQTWSAPTYDEALYDSSCQAHLYPLDAGRWLFTHPAGPGRRNLTARLSTDEGKTWSAGKLLRAGDSQYSCCALLPGETIGCLYESWVDKNYRIYFTRFGLDGLAGK